MAWQQEHQAQQTDTFTSTGMGSVTSAVTFSSMHGLRHAYAQGRYEELPGWKCPTMGGPDSKSFTLEQREPDREARLVTSQELEHEREQVTV